MIHLTFFVGQLACAIARGGIDHRRRHNFYVSGFAGFVEEEVDERALQLCAFAFVDGESGTCDLHSEVEVDQVVFLSQLPVRQCVGRKFGFHASHFLYYVVVGAYAFGHFVIRNVRDGIEQGLQVFGCLVHFGLQGFVGFLQFGYTAFGCFGFLFLSFFHQLSDGFGYRVHFSEVVI